MLSIEKRKVEKNIKIKDLFDLCLIDKTKENESKNNFDIKIKTPLGFLNIEYFFCTEPLNKKRIILENGTHLLAADKHLVMTAHGWSHIRDLKIGDLIVTKDGNFKLKEATNNINFTLERKILKRISVKLKLDYVLYKNLRLLSNEKILNYKSDHFPIISTFSI